MIAKAFTDEMEKIAAKEWTAHGIHRRLGAYKVPRAEWDNNPEFMAWTKRLVGKEHLDAMDPDELKRVARAIARKYRPRKAKSGPRPGTKHGKLTKGQRRYRSKSPYYFGGEVKLSISSAEMAAYSKRARQAGTSNRGATLKKTAKGFSVHTHRARSKWYPTVEAIPLDRIRWIASTG